MADAVPTTSRSTPPASKLIHHPIVGDLDLPYESFPLTPDLSQSLLAYTAEPGSPSQDALRLLASWAATTGGREVAAQTDDSKQTESFGKGRLNMAAPNQGGACVCLETTGATPSEFLSTWWVLRTR